MEFSNAMYEQSFDDITRINSVVVLSSSRSAVHSCVYFDITLLERGQQLKGYCASSMPTQYLRASEGTLSCWSRLRLQSLPTPVSRRVGVRQVV
jgi:hypothetical protein